MQPLQPLQPAGSDGAGSGQSRTRQKCPTGPNPAPSGNEPATAQVMNRFLNRLPTVTIREGHRVKVYLTNDLDLPAYEDRPLVAPSVAARVP